MTSDEPGMTSDQRGGVRAGFWRRALSLFIDYTVISLPFQLIVAFLFVPTGCRIQMYTGAPYVQSCSVLNTLPDGLAPPPPAGSNFARECKVYAFLGRRRGEAFRLGVSPKKGRSRRPCRETTCLIETVIRSTVCRSIGS